MENRTVRTRSLRPELLQVTPVGPTAPQATRVTTASKEPLQRQSQVCPIMQHTDNASSET